MSTSRRSGRVEWRLRLRKVCMGLTNHRTNSLSIAYRAGVTSRAGSCGRQINTGSPSEDLSPNPGRGLETDIINKPTVDGMETGSQ